MELRFLGQTYTTTNNRVATVATEQTASFKGQKYQVRVPVQPIKSQLTTAEMKYRGVAYIVEPRRHSMGSIELNPSY